MLGLMSIDSGLAHRSWRGSTMLSLRRLMQKDDCARDATVREAAHLVILDLFAEMKGEEEERMEVEDVAANLR